MKLSGLGLVLLSAAPLCGSGTGLMPMGDPISAAHSPNGSFQVVHLRRSGPVLTGTPMSAHLKIVVVEAPAFDELDLIVRERELSHGETLLQVTAPVQKGQLSRISLFFSSAQDSDRLFSTVAGEWEEQKLDRLAGRPRAGGTSEALAGVILTAPALVYLDTREPGLRVSAELPLPSFGAFDSERRLGRAAWHVAAPALTLLALWALSQIIHRKTLARG